jgi:translation elongation factor EF-G
MEPVYTIDVFSTESFVPMCVLFIESQGGKIIEKIPLDNSNVIIVRAYLAVSRSVGFSSNLNCFLRTKSALVWYMHTHWEKIEEDPLTPGTFAHELMCNMRKRYGWGPLPDLSTLGEISKVAKSPYSAVPVQE